MCYKFRSYGYCQHTVLGSLKIGIYKLFRLEWSCGAEISVYEILCDFPHFAYVGTVLLLWTLTKQPSFMHKPLYTLMVDSMSSSNKFLINSSDPISALIFCENIFDFIQKVLVSLCNCIYLFDFIVVSRFGNSHSQK